MTDLTLLVECDNGSAPSISVSLGDGWARVTARGGPAREALRRARAMLEAGAPEALRGAPRVRVTGPDTPSSTAELAGLTAELERVWAELAPAGEGQSPAAEVPMGGEAAPAAPSGLEVITADVYAYLAEGMARAVRAHVARHGAAPDFGLGRPADREKVYNYIRSTTARQQAPDDLVEAVRRRLVEGR